MMVEKRIFFISAPEHKVTYCTLIVVKVTLLQMQKVMNSVHCPQHHYKFDKINADMMPSLMDYLVSKANFHN